MVDQVVPSWISVGRCGEVDSVCFAYCLCGIVVAVQPHKWGVEILKILGDARRAIPRWVHRYKDGQDYIPMFFFYRQCSYEKKENMQHLRVDFNTVVTLSNSVGQISGQLVKPKYTKDHLPSSSFWENGLPSCVASEKGPPMCGLPNDFKPRSRSTRCIRKGIMGHSSRFHLALLPAELFRDGSRQPVLLQQERTAQQK